MDAVDLALVVVIRRRMRIRTTYGARQGVIA
jgi:hypothetical protein